MTTTEQTAKIVEIFDSKGRTYATGRRKNAVARVWVKTGTGKIVVNNRDADEYFVRIIDQTEIRRPFRVIKADNQFDVWCTAAGGGTTGQAGAIKLGISRALDKYNPDYHTTLASSKLLTRDDRMVESKKYGRHKARKGTQFAKR